MSVLKNSVGVWAFGPAVTRFVPPGYHHEVSGEDMLEKTKRVASGLSDLLDGLEYHYPGEINEDNVEEIISILKDYGIDLPIIAAGLHPDPTYGKGAFINPDDKFIWDLAAKIEREGLREAKSRADALLGQREVYRAMGLEEDFEAEVVRRRQELRAGRRSPRGEGRQA